jgi:hypothetical protein
MIKVIVGTFFGAVIGAFCLDWVCYLDLGVENYETQILVATAFISSLITWSLSFLKGKKEVGL